MLLYSLLEWLEIKSCLLFLVLLLILTDFLKNRDPPNFPPGPLPLPFLGNIFAGFDCKSVDKLAVEYGSVFRLRRGSVKTVFVSGYKMVKEMLVNQEGTFVDRPVSPLVHDIFKDYGISAISGYKWRRQRQFATTHLKNVGELQSHILQECRFLCEAMGEERGGCFDPHIIIKNAVANVMGSLVFGQRFEYDDTQFQNLLGMIAECVHLAGTAHVQLYNAFPWLMRRLHGSHEKVISNYAKLTAVLKKEIEKHKKDWDPFVHRDFIDSYIGEIDKRKRDTEAGFNTDNLAYSCLDLFEAGTATVTNTLRCALLFMMMNPEVQEKVQAEIRTVVGTSRQPTLADRVNMPYTDAVIHEIQRKGNVVPLNAARMATKDTTLGGYFLPKGTVVIANLSSVLNDTNEWETPQQFNPGQFLDSQGKFRKREAFFPFSAGKRVCLGESLARKELFLFFTSLLQRFTFTPPPGIEPSLEAQAGATLSPKSFQIQVSAHGCPVTYQC